MTIGRTTTKLPHLIGRTFEDPEDGLLVVIDAERVDYADTHGIYKTRLAAVVQTFGNPDPEDLFTYEFAELPFEDLYA